MKLWTLRKRSQSLYCYGTANKPNGNKTRKESSLLNLGGKLQRVILGKTHTVRKGLKPQPLSAPDGIQTRVQKVELGGKESQLDHFPKLLSVFYLVF